MATHCDVCEKFLVSTVANPTVALSSGTYHYDCYRGLAGLAEAEALKKREAADEKAAREVARQMEIREARSARMKLRWAAKRENELGELREAEGADEA
jgi:hypothetical protein